MGQIKNIKLHIVTDIKLLELKMARSLRSSRRKKNKQALRARYKPIYDKRLQEIVKNMQQETNELMETAGDIDLENNVQVLELSDDSSMITNDENINACGDNEQNEVEVAEEKKKKMPRVDIKKLTKFMSQRKLRTFKAKQKADKKAAKMGQKKKKTFKW